MNNDDIIIKIIKESSEDEKILYKNLYDNYNLIYKNYDINNLPENINYDSKIIDSKAKLELEKLEDRVYTVNGRVLSQKERIAIELKNILRFINDNESNIDKKLCLALMKELKLLMSLKTKIDLEDPTVIKYMKKHISIIQSYLGLKIKFFNAAIEALYDQIINKNIKNNYIFEEPGKGK